MEVILKENRNFSPLDLLVTPSCLPAQNPYTRLFHLLTVVLHFARFLIQVLGHGCAAISRVWAKLRALDF